MPALNVSDTGRKILLAKFQPDLAAEPTPEHFEAVYNLLTGDLHVRRLLNFWHVMESLVEGPPSDQRVRPGQNAPERDAAPIDQRRYSNGHGKHDGFDPATSTRRAVGLLAPASQLIAGEASGIPSTFAAGEAGA